jgi:multidrug efflux pump subunit AcrA (membrane-fusion protein)
MGTSKLDQLKIDREPEREDRPVRWPLLAVILIVFAAAGYWFFLQPEKAIGVRTAVAREISQQAANTVLNASGYVTARRQATVSSKFTGKVVEVLIEEGMLVEKDQVLARLDNSNVTTSFALAEAQLKSAQTSLKETDALLTEARAIFTRTKNLVERVWPARLKWTGPALARSPWQRRWSVSRQMCAWRKSNWMSTGSS